MSDSFDYRETKCVIEKLEHEGFIVDVEDDDFNVSFKENPDDIIYSTCSLSSLSAFYDGYMVAKK
jgi:hypothetical protein